jgi:hypothetical protein
MFLKSVNPSGPICFLHIPRTAGTSLRWAAAAQYGNEKICLVRYDYYTETEAIDKQNKFKMITGHITMGGAVVQNLLGGWSLLTILRYPLTRFLSYYHYADKWTKNNEHDEIKSHSLEEAIKNPKFHNNLCKYLGGADPDTMYQNACNNIKNEVTLFGFFEAYPEFLAMIQRRFNWGGMVIRREEHVEGVPDLDDLPKELYDELVEQNRMDIDFYGYAKSLYEEKRLHWLE